MSLARDSEGTFSAEKKNLAIFGRGLLSFCEPQLETWVCLKKMATPKLLIIVVHHVSSFFPQFSRDLGPIPHFLDPEKANL